MLAAVDIEPLTDTIARLAGEALAKVRGATIVDAFVMASAALRGARAVGLKRRAFGLGAWRGTDDVRGRSSRST